MVTGASPRLGNESEEVQNFFTFYTPRIVHLSDYTETPKGDWATLTLIMNCTVRSGSVVEKGLIDWCDETRHKDLSTTAEISYCTPQGFRKEAFKMVKLTGTCTTEVFPAPFESPLAEVHLSDTIASTEKLNETFTHISPQLYDTVVRLASRRVRYNVQRALGTGRLDLVLDAIHQGLTKEIENAERRSDKRNQQGKGEASTSDACADQ